MAGKDEQSRSSEETRPGTCSLEYAVILSLIIVLSYSSAAFMGNGTVSSLTKVSDAMSSSNNGGSNNNNGSNNNGGNNNNGKGNGKGN